MFPCLLAFIVSCASVGAVRAFAVRSKVLVDVPNSRSSHTVPTPRGGGLGIVAGYVLACLFLATPGAVSHSGPWALQVAGGLLVAAVGFADDNWGLSAASRFVVHAVAAVMAVASVSTVPPLVVGDLLLWDWGWVGKVILVIGAIWLIDLTNFMDGIDGLAGSEAVFVCAVCGSLALVNGTPELALKYFALGAASLGFLFWNWPPARIFMGDVGSGFLGYWFAALLISGFGRGTFSIWTGLIPLGVFATDATLTLFRRMASGQRFYEAHRTHAYQHAARRWGHQRTTVAIWILNIFGLGTCTIAAYLLPRYDAETLLLSAAGLALLAHRYKAGQPGETGER